LPKTPPPPASTGIDDGSEGLWRPFRLGPAAAILLSRRLLVVDGVCGERGRIGSEYLRPFQSRDPNPSSGGAVPSRAISGSNPRLSIRGVEPAGSQRDPD